MIVPLQQIPGKEYIPAGGSLEITGDDFVNLFPGYDWEFGQAVKLLIKVPSGAGCISEIGTLSGSDFGDEYGSLDGSTNGTYNNATYTYNGTFTGDYNGYYAGYFMGDFAGTGCYVNPYDPYIEGIVVSVWGSVQRSVPIKFKAFKQGQYNE